MASKPNQPALLRFRGAPEAIEGLAPLTFQKAVAAPVAFNVKLPSAISQEEPINWQAEPAGVTATLLRISLPEITPPGRYDGEVSFGTDRYPITVEVDPQPNILISPRHLTLQAASGTELPVDLTILNTGNVVVDVPRAHGFGLFDVKGVERGVAAALQDSTEKGQGRINRLADEVAESHGGLVRVRVQEGAGALAPGEMRHLHVVFHFANRLKPGRRYYGTWSLLNLEYHVEVQITGEAPIEKE